MSSPRSTRAKASRFRRDPNYWGRDLPINRGLWNFEELRFDYYRDANAYFEAFKTGLFDVRAEQDPSRWQTGYDIPAVRDGRIIKDAFRTAFPRSPQILCSTPGGGFSPTSACARRSRCCSTPNGSTTTFSSIFIAASASFFDGSELSAFQRPADATERALLAPFPDAVRADVLDGTWSPPATTASGRDRKSLRQALALLGAAGFELKGAPLRERTSGQPFTFRDHGDEPRR